MMCHMFCDKVTCIFLDGKNYVLCTYPVTTYDMIFWDIC
jgi:hypothetical protein